MVNKKIADLINRQINREFYSAYLYLDIANFYIEKNLDGFGNWFRIQTQEERDHALFFIQYLQNNGEKVVFEAIAKPQKSYTNFQEPLKESFEHELFITQSIHEIYAEAQQQKDFKTMQFLDWFVKEQGEEEKNTDDLCKRFELFGTDPRSLYMLDTELKARTYVAAVMP